MSTLTFLIGACLFSFGVHAEDSPKPDRWKGLIVGESTPEECSRILGQAASDKPDRLFLQPIEKWFVPGLNRKALRKVTYTGVPGFKRVDLYFRDGVLVVIQLAPESTIHPTALPGIYGIEFRPFIDGFVEGMVGGVERHKGSAYPVVYPIEYALVAEADQSVIKANILNSGIGRALKRSTGAVDTAGGGFPGKVGTIQLISRKLANRAGADLLR